MTSSQRTICHILHSLEVGGAEMMASQLAIASQPEFHIKFICLDEVGSMAPALQRRGFEVVDLNRRPGLDLACSRKIGRLIREWGIDLLHVHQYAPFFYGSAARLMRSRPPIVFTEHGRDFPDPRRTKRALANRVLFRRSDRAIGVGEHVRRSLIDKEALPADQTSIIYNGIDLSPFDRQRKQREEVRKELGIESGGLMIIQVARLNPLKDHSTALRAMRIVTQRIEDAHLVLVGDGEERAGLVDLINSLELSERVHLTGSRNDVHWLLQGADIFLLTSVSEGLPIVLLEAMATALPCVSSRVGGVPEVIEDTVTGFLVDPASPEATAEALITLARDESLRTRMASEACRRVARNFDQRDMFDAYRALYLDLLDTP